MVNLIFTLIVQYKTDSFSTFAK